jgi:hypothetical protein
MTTSADADAALLAAWARIEARAREILAARRAGRQPPPPPEEPEEGAGSP